MKIYERNKELKWYEKVKWLRLIVFSIILTVVVFLLFYFIIGSKTNITRAIITSVIIGLLSFFEMLYTNVLEYEQFTPIIRNKKLIFVIKQKETDFYDTDVKLKTDIDFSNREEIESIISKVDKNIGINIYEVDKCDIIKEKNNYFILNTEGTKKVWYLEENKKKLTYKIKDKHYKKKYKIDNSFNNYEELLSKIKDIKE